ncbi:MAG: DUF2007 domain-containing protein [Acidobacteriota bacterium]
MTKPSSEEWVEVAGVGQDEEAELIAGFLESEGIPCEVEGPSMTPFPEDLGAFGTSRVMVPPERAEEAREVIARRQREFETGGGSGEEGGGESEE